MPAQSTTRCSSGKTGYGDGSHADAAEEVGTISEEALELLERAHWQGNVRELQHAIERAFILAGTEAELLPEHFPSQWRMEG